jgi:sugar phosphate isomerase/epimerase
VRLAISNIAWDARNAESVLAFLADTPIQGVEIAPTKLWPDWVGASTLAAVEVRRIHNERGLAIPSIQSLLFGKAELKVFGPPETRAALLDHIEMTASVGAALGATVLVFGSPRNRDPGDLDPSAAHGAALDFFRSVGDRCARHGVRLCIEPNPKVYDCRFITSWREAAAFVDELDHPGVGLHLDTACIALEGDDVVEAIRGCAGRIAHFHISEPQLGDFAEPKLDHASYGAALRTIGYEGWASIEMRPASDALAGVAQAVAHAARHYSS